MWKRLKWRASATKVSSTRLNGTRINWFRLNSEAVKRLIYRCAELHLTHIGTRSGDPFEMGSARPLDFGHWAAHQLEQLSKFTLSHGEAVAIGIALDVTYSAAGGIAGCQILRPDFGFARTAGVRNLYADELLAVDAKGDLYGCPPAWKNFANILGGRLDDYAPGGDRTARCRTVHKMSAKEDRRGYSPAAGCVPGKNETPRRHQCGRIDGSAHRRAHAAHRRFPPTVARWRRWCRPFLPPVTCTAQSNYLTGKPPTQHGIVGNGWFNRELAEVHFWKQSNHVVQSPKIWDALRAATANERATVANCFWWYNMYSSVDYSITPRPVYQADGGKIFDIYSWPYSIREEIKKDLGEFPFFGFWARRSESKTPQGSADGTSRWIAESAKWMEKKFSPTLNLVYLPHLDYNLQRHGPYASAGGINAAIIPDLRAIDSIVGELIDFFGQRGVQVVLLSEYGITNVNTTVHLNRIFRKQGWLVLKDELGLEILDAGASKVFAVADHQVAHVYLNDRSLEKSVRDILEKTPGVEKFWATRKRPPMGIAHTRAGRFDRGGGVTMPGSPTLLGG